jgi:hypothetical protein
MYEPGRLPPVFAITGEIVSRGRIRLKTSRKHPEAKTPIIIGTITSLTIFISM